MIPGRRRHFELASGEERPSGAGFGRIRTEALRGKKRPLQRRFCRRGRSARSQPLKAPAVDQPNRVRERQKGGLPGARQFVDHCSFDDHYSRDRPASDHRSSSSLNLLSLNLCMILVAKPPLLVDRRSIDPQSIDRQSIDRQSKIVNQRSSIKSPQSSRH